MSLLLAHQSAFPTISGAATAQARAGEITATGAQGANLIVSATITQGVGVDYLTVVFREDVIEPGLDLAPGDGSAIHGIYAAIDGGSDLFPTYESGNGTDTWVFSVV